MIERDFALKLRYQLDGIIFQKRLCFYKYEHNEEELIICNYKLLQEECKKLGFYIYKVTESPIFQEDHINMRYKNEAYIIYSDYSLTLKSKF